MAHSDRRNSPTPGNKLKRFQTANPTLQAGRIGIDESRAEEVTAYLRPNPDFTFSLDQIQAFTSPFQPFAYLFPSYAASYLHERRHKRELRLESAKKATTVAGCNWPTKREPSS